MNPLHSKLLAHLLAAFAAGGKGDSGDDDGAALADQIAKAAELQDAIAAVVRSARADERMVEHLAADIAALQARKSRLDVRAQRKRDVALSAMVQAGEPFRRIEVHDFTVLVKATAPVLLVTDPEVLPAEYYETPAARLKKSDLLRDLKRGADILGASLTNGAPTLQISCK